MSAAKQVTRAQDVFTAISELKASYTNETNLEITVYINLRGHRNNDLRRQIARFIGLPDRPINVVSLARELKYYFDRAQSP